MIEVEGLEKRFDEVLAVGGVSLRVDAGEILGLVGINGAGKTTLLRMLAGILGVGAGSIRIAGHPMNPDAVEARRQLAFVPDTPMLFDTLTVNEHLLFIAELYRVADPEPRIEALLAEFELSDKRHSVASALSRGMRQKLAICCAFLHEPAALLLDEPLTGLDPPGRRSMCEAIAARARDGAAVLVSSHQLEIVERVSTRFAILHRGQLRATGTLDEIRATLGEQVDGANLEELFLHATTHDAIADPRADPSEAADA
ncbi:MAG: multidrug ABC transporter ATP-binding protein [Planctomycetota bacterium]|nr:MAG: multidrug ABC transporter ATP-binding protein [Planctomycetota bacterium]